MLSPAPQHDDYPTRAPDEAHVPSPRGLRLVSPAVMLDQPAGGVALPARPYAHVVKRACDLLTTTILLILLCPLLALIALAITLDSPGPIFYNRTRVGKDGREFVMYKFRTMGADAERRLADLQHLNKGGAHMVKIVGDPRVTRAGRLLRASSLDELPQLFNVLKGEMSMVGPRPQTPTEVALYNDEQRRRLAVAPGITGLWQVSDRHNPSFERWVHWDLTYIAQWSLWLDARIVWRTAVMIAADSSAAVARLLMSAS